MDKIEPTDEMQSCPCCGQAVKLYRRKILGAMAYDLIRLYHMTLSGEYMHIKDFAKGTARNGDFAKLKYWKLVEQKDHVPDEKRNNGYWKITELGEKFVTNKASVQKYAHTFNDKVRGRSGDQIWIKDALGEKFDYSSLMRGAV